MDTAHDPNMPTMAELIQTVELADAWAAALIRVATTSVDLYLATANEVDDPSEQTHAWMAATAAYMKGPPKL